MSNTSVQRVIKRFDTKNTNTKNLKKSYQGRHKSLTERDEIMQTQKYTITQRSIHAQPNSGMGTNVGQRGLSQTGTVWLRRWSLSTTPAR